MAEETTYRTSNDEMRIELPETAPPPEVDPQAERRAEIAEAYERRREQEIVAQREQMGLPAIEVVADEGEGGAEALPKDHSGSQPEAPEPAPDAPAVAPEAPPPQAPMQLIPMPLPDGRITHVTPEQAAYLAQIGAATLSQPQRTPQAPQQAYQPAPMPQATHKPSFDGERAKAIAQRLSFGTTDEQAAALVEFAELVRPEVPQIDVQALRRDIKQEVRQENRLEQNLAIIGQEYPEVFNDPVLSQVAALQLSEMRRNPYFASQKSDLDQYREACNNVRSRFQNAAPQQPQPGSQVTPPALQAAPSAQRLERKRAAPSIPGGADHRLVMADATPREPTTAEVIAQIRKSRGQPSVS